MSRTQQDPKKNRTFWLVSARFDGAWVFAPPLLAVAMVLALPQLRTFEIPPWGFLVFVIFIDVGHVYASLYRTYWDADEMARRRGLYVATPLLCWIVGVMLYAQGSIVFWRVLAYMAVYHFVRQQFGFMMLYRHRMGERDPWDKRLDTAVIYASMLYPLAFWHSTERNFQWFLPGDFFTLPPWVGSAAAWIHGSLLTLFVLRQLQLWTTRRFVNPGKIGVVLSTAAVWFVGIVFLNSDFAFTVTNVVAHGVPYVALVWLYGRRRWQGQGNWLETLHRPAYGVAFVGLLLAFGYLEEGVWDVLVWQEHASLFASWLGSLPTPELSEELLMLVVPLLTVPQATHYVLDAWIWKFDGSNPDLKEHLFPT